MKELDLTKPIFLIKIAIYNMSQKRVQEYLHSIKELIDHTNITTWYMLTKEENDIKCIYNCNKNNINKDDFIELINDINERINIISNSNSYEDFKINIRDYRINKINK